MPDVAEIAGSLSEAQREVVLAAPLQEPKPAYAFIAGRGGGEVAGCIRRMNPLFTKMDRSRFGSQVWFYRLTPLGLAVRAYLENSRGTD